MGDLFIREISNNERKNLDVFTFRETERPVRHRKEGTVDNRSGIAWVEKYLPFTLARHFY